MDWNERAEKSKGMIRINYTQYLQLKEEEMTLPLLPTVELPQIT